MLSSSLDTLLKVSKTTSHQKLFAYDCVTLYVYSVKQSDQNSFLLNLVSVAKCFYLGFATRL